MPTDEATKHLLEALHFYADPKNWWNQNVDDRLNWHNANLEGSMERMNAKPGVIRKLPNVVHAQFFNDGGDRARKALEAFRKATR